MRIKIYFALLFGILLSGFMIAYAQEATQSPVSGKVFYSKTDKSGVKPVSNPLKNFKYRCTDNGVSVNCVAL